MIVLVYKLSSAPRVILCFFSPSLAEMELHVTRREPCGYKTIHAAVRGMEVGLKDLKKSSFTVDSRLLILLHAFNIF